MRYALILAFLLSACAPPTRSTGWFVAHPEEMNRVLYRCETHVQADAECEAAHDALLKKQDERMKLFRKGF